MMMMMMMMMMDRWQMRMFKRGDEGEQLGEEEGEYGAMGKRGQPWKMRMFKKSQPWKMRMFKR